MPVYQSISDLGHLVPSESLVEEYESRQWGGFQDLEMIHTLAREMKHNILLYGDTGSAKTMVARVYAARERLPFYRIPLNGSIDVPTLVGKYVPREDGTFAWSDGPATLIVRYGGVLLLDEINFPHPKMMSVLFPLLDAQRILPVLDHDGEVVSAHEDLVIIATMNPDYEGTRPLNAALRNRFAVQREWGYEPAVESALVGSAALLGLATQLRGAYKSGDLMTPTPTNRLMEFEDFTERVGFDFAAENFVQTYSPDEQSSVRQAVKLHATAIRAELEREGDTA